MYELSKLDNANAKPCDSLRDDLDSCCVIIRDSIKSSLWKELDHAHVLKLQGT